MSDLWCVHIIGPDDMIACPSKAAAETEAAALNAMIAKQATLHADKNWPVCSAEVMLWPFSAKAHADDLAKG
jgi:hypothetical protein